MRFKLILFSLLLLESCKSAGNSSQLQSGSNNSATQFLSTISSRNEFDALSRPNQISYPFVKYSYMYGVPQTDPVYDQIYFQNTQKYEFHVGFFNDHIERYKTVRDNQCLILPPRDGETCPSVKEMTAGAVYHRPATATEPELLAYEIYFWNETSASGTVKTKIDVAEVARFDKKIKAAVSFVPAASIVYILPEKADFFAFKSKLEGAGVKIVKSWEFHKPVVGSKSYVEASSYGYLRNISPADFDAGLYSDQDILVFDNVPLDVGPVSGIITTKPVAAHSHVIFRAQNLGVPAMYIPEALNVASLKGNLGKLVKFTASAGGVYTIEGGDKIPSLEADAAAYWKSRRQTLPTPVADLTTKNVKVWNKDGVSPDDIKSYGAKATNFAILDKALVASGVDRARYSNGFMVPFASFDIHMNTKISAAICEEANKKCSKDVGKACSAAAATCSTASSGTIRDFVTAMLESENLARMNSEPAHRREYLAFTQRIIRETPVSPEIIKPIQEAMSLYPKTVRMRLRSSTNAEDIAGLNGAGLYESKSACLGDDESASDKDGKPSACRTPLEMERMKAQAEKLRTFADPDGKFKVVADEIVADITKKYPLSKTITSVYASLWTERAFLTREYYGLKHLGIYMGMLGHPSFVDESANGVAVVEFKDGKASSVNIEGQYDDISVTNPIFPETTPEMWTASITSGIASNLTIKQQSTLSSSGKTVLNQAEVSELTRQLAIAASALRAARGGNRYDLEFILGKNREVLIKQGRPL